MNERTRDVRRAGLCAAISVLLTLGCAQRTTPPVSPPISPPQPPSTAQQQSFDRMLSEFARLDRTGGWTEEACRRVAGEFAEFAEATRQAVARHDAGVALQRCGMHQEAESQFRKAFETDASLHAAEAQLVLYDFGRDHDAARAIGRLETLLRRVRFQNLPALVSLAALQMERDNSVATDDGKSDLDRAKLNLTRALAIDDRFVPAMNQLALYHLQASRTAPPGKLGPAPGKLGLAGTSEPARGNRQRLDLAALVASQGLGKHPGYAPLHNTAGLIQVALGDLGAAAKSFATARRLDPRFVEAHMNYAALNLSFRGFAEAERGYRSALALDPKSYEAQLGLALALRGQIGKGDRHRIEEAAVALAKARQLDPKRPEAYYNEAILTQEFEAKDTEQTMIPALTKAKRLYRTFIERAGSDPAFAAGVTRAKERSQDIDDTIEFLRSGKTAAAP